MKIAAIAAAAPFAVSSFGLAALAVSASLFSHPAGSTRTSERPCSPSRHAPERHATLGAITVVGTPDYEAVVDEARAYEPLFARCATTTTRVTIYAHVRDGWASEPTVLGTDEAAAACVRDTFRGWRFSFTEDADVMIPVELQD